jgi:hypothetical protein
MGLAGALYVMILVRVRGYPFTISIAEAAGRFNLPEQYTRAPPIKEETNILLVVKNEGIFKSEKALLHMATRFKCSIHPVTSQKAHLRFLV